MERAEGDFSDAFILSGITFVFCAKIFAVISGLKWPVGSTGA